MNFEAGKYCPGPHGAEAPSPAINAMNHVMDHTQSLPQEASSPVPKA